MLFIFPQGRFGNQVFQYAFAKDIAKKNEKIFTIKMEYFDIVEEKNDTFIILDAGKLYKYINFGCNHIFRMLAKLRIITGIYQNIGYYNGYKGRTGGNNIKKGLFNNIQHIDGFFIYEGSHIKNGVPLIKKHHVNEAKLFLNKLPKKSLNIFVHVRRGDYLERSVGGKKNLSLPIEFYKKQISFFIDTYKDPNFIFLSDDIKWCENNFGYLDNSFFSKNGLGTDFSIMTLCDGAIISASTFSYLGAYFMKEKVEIFAPNYWLGFKDSVWFPKGIETKRFNYIDVL